MQAYYYAMDFGDGSCGVRWATPERAKQIRKLADEGEDGYWYASESLTEVHVSLEFLTLNPHIRIEEAQ